MDADDLAGDVEVLHLRARLAQTVQGSWSLPPMRIRDLVFPGVDVGAGRMIGGGSLGRTPEAMSSRIWRGGRRQSWGSEPWIPLPRPPDILPAERDIQYVRVSCVIASGGEQRGLHLFRSMVRVVNPGPALMLVDE